MTKGTKEVKEENEKESERKRRCTVCVRCESKLDFSNEEKDGLIVDTASSKVTKPTS